MSGLDYLVEKYRPQMDTARYGGKLLKDMTVEQLAAVLLSTLDACEAFNRRMQAEEIQILEAAHMKVGQALEGMARGRLIGKA